VKKCPVCEREFSEEQLEFFRCADFRCPIPTKGMSGLIDVLIPAAIVILGNIGKEE